MDNKEKGCCILVTAGTVVWIIVLVTAFLKFINWVIAMRKV